MAASKVPNSFVRLIRKMYNALGFKKGYNFALCKSSHGTQPAFRSLMVATQSLFLPALYLALFLPACNISLLMAIFARVHHRANGTGYEAALEKLALPFIWLPYSQLDSWSLSRYISINPLLSSMSDAVP